MKEQSPKPGKKKGLMVIEQSGGTKNNRLRAFRDGIRASDWQGEAALRASRIFMKFFGESDMSGRGKKITIHLLDGNPSGIKDVQIGNWGGRVIVCPRFHLKDLLKNWSERIQHPGVYLMSGEDEKSNQTTVYIGQAGKNVAERLRYHLSQDEKSFWNQTFIFTSKEKEIDVGYIEACMIKKAREADRVLLDNSQKPDIPSLSESDQDVMDEYLEYAQGILTVLGISYFRPYTQKSTSVHENSTPLRQKRAKRSIQTEETSSDFFYFSGKKIKGRGVRTFEGRGVRTVEGFVVLKGSTGKLEPAISLNQNMRDKRDSLKKEKKTSIKDQHIHFKKDVLFSNSSAAASVLAGGMRSGKDSWKDKDGRTLKQREEEEESILSTEESVSKDGKKPKSKASKATDLPKAPERKSQTGLKKNSGVMPLFEAGLIKAGDKIWLKIKGKPSSKATLTKDGNCRFGKEVISLNDYAKAIADAESINIYRRIIHGPTNKTLDELRKLK